MHSKRIVRVLVLTVPLIFCIYLLLHSNIDSASLSKLCINEIMAKSIGPDWIELYNGSDNSINLEGYGLSDEIGNPYKYTFHDVTIESGEYMILLASDEIEDVQNNCGFCLNSDGSSLFLTDGEGNEIDSFTYGIAEYEISYGREEKDKTSILQYGHATPGEANSSMGYNLIQDGIIPVDVDKMGGFYEAPIEINLESDASTILYTLDGNTPDLESTIYSEPIRIDNEGTGDGVVLRARTYEDNRLGPVMTETYYIGDVADSLPVVSLVVEPEEMFGNVGIYESGNIGHMLKTMGVSNNTIDNYRLDTSIKASIEVRNVDSVYSSDAYLKLQGGSSRFCIRQKSFELNLTNPYVIDGNVSSEIKLRSAGGGEHYSYCKVDSYVYSVCKDLDIGVPNLEFVDLYINGEYWGIYTLQESDHNSFFENHYGLKENEIASLSYVANIDNDDRVEAVLKEGSGKDKEDYENLFSEVLARDFSKQENYDWLCEQIDIENYTDYMIAETFFVNIDWPRHNVLVWRSKELDEDNPYADRRWRWKAYDFDTCMDFAKIEQNTILDYQNYENEENISIELTKMIMRKLWDNYDYRYYYFERCRELLNSTLSQDNLLNQFDSHYSIISRDMEKNLAKLYSGYRQYDYKPDKDAKIEVWNQDIATMRSFAEERTAYILSSLDYWYEVSKSEEIISYRKNGNLKAYLKTAIDNGYVTIIETSGRCDRIDSDVQGMLESVGIDSSSINSGTDVIVYSNGSCEYFDELDNSGDTVTSSIGTITKYVDENGTYGEPGTYGMYNSEGSEFYSVKPSEDNCNMIRVVLMKDGEQFDIYSY